MHSAVLDATGYTLLVSSFITLVILLWKGCKHKKESSFYILSASDIFSAILTAIILLVNHIDDGIRLSYNWQNNTNGDIFDAWTIGDDYRFPFLQTPLREAVNEIDLNVTLMCGMKDLLMHYGMLIAALTNAFISLLTFTVQCNLNAVCVKRRYADVIKSLKNTHLEPKKVEVKYQESEILEKEQEPASQQRDNIKIKSNIIQRNLKISKFRTLKEDDKRPTSFLVTSHWLVPFLVLGMLYFAEYNDMNDARDAEDIECIFGSNFPMNDFDTFSVTNDNLNTTDSVTYMTLPEHNFFNEMLSNKSKPSSTEIDEVVSKVQSIVRTALRYTSNSATKTTDFFDTPRLQNLTQYILIHNLMKYINNITNVNGILGLNSTLNSILIEQDINVPNSSTNNIYLNQDPEVFYDVSKNASKELDATTSRNLGSVSQMLIKKKDDSYQEDAQVHFASTEENIIQKTTDTSIVKNTTFVSNNQIYDEIMKRIQAASVYSAKNHYNHSVNRWKSKDGNQSEINNLKNYIEKRKPNSIKDLFSNKNDNRHINIGTKQSSSLLMTNECLISTKFLKLQLFVLSFAIYFLPILFSSILQMRGKHMCKNILAILRAKTDLTSTDSKKIYQEKEDSSSVEGSSMPQRSRSHHWTDTDAIKKDHESCRENESMALEIECMVKIFDTITLSLILCIVLWTPIFLGTLLRVYSCIRAPQWLNDVTFLSAVSFGIIRNALNINIIRIQEACSDNMKENRIHPVE